MAATFEKANTYVFAALIIRDREVGGSNPLAPTNNSQSINYRFIDHIAGNGEALFERVESLNVEGMVMKRRTQSTAVCAVG